MPCPGSLASPDRKPGVGGYVDTSGRSESEIGTHEAALANALRRAWSYPTEISRRGPQADLVAAEALLAMDNSRQLHAGRLQIADDRDVPWLANRTAICWTPGRDRRGPGGGLGAL